MSATEIRQPSLVVVEHALEGDPLARVGELGSGTGVVDVLIDAADNTIPDIATVFVSRTITECILVGDSRILTVMLGRSRGGPVEGEELVNLYLSAFAQLGDGVKTY